MYKFFKTFNLSWRTFVVYLPALTGGIICFLITLFLANFISKLKDAGYKFAG